MSKNKDFLYEHPPLVEVISEIRWNTTPVASIPGMSIDPHFIVFSRKLGEVLNKEGFVNSERLVPEEVPIELTAGNPIYRYRKSPKKWPLYQAGPGLFTSNITPPYDGWGSFKKFLDKGVSHLFNCYPMASEYLDIKSLELRYIDAFSKKNGPVKNYHKFLRDHLGIHVNLSSDLVGDVGKAKLIGDIVIPLPNIDNSIGIISLKPGKKGKDDAIIMELILRKNEGLDSYTKKDIQSWFNNAHKALHDWFDNLCSQELKKTFGATKEIE